MLLHVYWLRERGVRRPSEEVARQALHGEVLLELVRPGWGPTPEHIARLLDPATQREVLPHLTEARVVRVRQALTLQGVERLGRGTKSRVTKYPQTWICAAQPIPPHQWPAWRPTGGIPGFEVEDDDLL